MLRETLWKSKVNPFPPIEQSPSYWILHLHFPVVAGGQAGPGEINFNGQWRVCSGMQQCVH